MRIPGGRVASVDLKVNAGAGKRIIPQLVVMGVASYHQGAIAQDIALDDVKLESLTYRVFCPPQMVLPARVLLLASKR